MSSDENAYTPSVGGTIHQLEIKPIFDALEQREKFYAHYLARAAWHGSRIIMRQVSPESPDVFDFILNLHIACDREWDNFKGKCDITSEELDLFLEYAATFLCNLGNFYKFVPGVNVDVVKKLASISPKTNADLDKIIVPLFAVPPFSLGRPSKNAQLGYYPNSGDITRNEIEMVSEIMNRKSIGLENTRIRKVKKEERPALQLLQASTDTDPVGLGCEELADGVFLVRGDHSAELARVCSALEKAREFAGNDNQMHMLTHSITYFRTGSLDAFQESQKMWVRDVAARVENVLGFIEPYRDPAGIRAEWEAMIGIADPDETRKLTKFVDNSTTFIRQLPWAIGGINDGKGPFEKSLFEPPDFTSVHALAVCGSIVFEAANLPNFDHIRETCGFKNVVLANRLSVNKDPNLPCYWIDASEFDLYKSTTHIVRYLTTAIHELIGHGSGKLLSETSAGIYNFDHKNPSISPLDDRVVTSYYLPGQTWGSVFGKLAGTVEECRAILMSEYLMDEKKLLSIFGYTEDSDITAEDLLYATYLNIGVDGVQALEHYNVHDQAWGRVHHQAHFSILKHLLQDGNGVVSVTYDPIQRSITVNVDRSKIMSHGKPSLGRYLCKLHIWRCTANVAVCKRLYESMCAVDGIYEQ